MKLKFTITAKAALAFIIVILAVVALLTFINYEKEDLELENDLNDQLWIYRQAFDAYFGNTSNLKNYTITKDIIDNFMNENPRIDSLNIILYNKNDETFKIFASNDENLRNQTTKYENITKKCILGYYPQTYLDKIKDHTYYLAIIPLYSENQGGYIGAYEIIINVQQEFKNINQAYQDGLKSSLALMFLVVVSVLFISRYIIQNPLKNLKEVATSYGKGDLSARIDFESSDELGELSAAFNQMADDLKKSRDKIEEYNKILEKILDRKDEFIGQLGHDLKNPLQPLIGLLPMMINQETNPKKKEMLQVMNDNVEYMRDLLFDTLKLAKLRSDKIEFNFETINLKQFTEKIIRSQKTMFDGKNINAVNNIGSDIYVEADELRLSEVFKNLLNNSLKYTKKSGKIILNSEDFNGKIKIGIIDNGVGMNKKQLSQIFDEFYKADKFTDEYHSTGLGLAIVKRIIEKHGGKIWAESEGEGKGSSFYFTLKKVEK